MSLYSFRKKIENNMKLFKDNCCNLDEYHYENRRAWTELETVLELFDKEILEIEFRVSQLEKEPETKTPSEYSNGFWAGDKHGQSKALRGVLGQ